MGRKEHLIIRIQLQRARKAPGSSAKEIAATTRNYHRKTVAQLLQIAKEEAAK